jgi:hypothetical protein
MNYFVKILILAMFVSINCVHMLGQDTTAASATWQVQKYDINATLPQSESDRYMTVKALLSVKNISAAPASTLTLRISSAAEISAVNVGGSVADFSKREEKINTSASLQRIVIRIPSVQQGGATSVTVDYKLNVKENSGAGQLSPLASQFLPLSFWYPTPNSWYFARGADYAPFHLSVNAPAGMTVTSSGADSANSFDQKLAGQPFFTTGNWEIVNQNGAIVYAPKGAAVDQTRSAELASLAVEAKTFVSNFLGLNLDTPIRIVGVRRGSGFTSGGTLLVDEGVFRRQKIDSQSAMSVAESVAKLFIGNAVVINGNGQGVLREGLPRYIATQFLESKYGKDIADIERMRQRNAYAAVVNRDSPLSTVAPLDDYYYPEVANKGAMVWRLLAKKIGSDEFANALRGTVKDGQIDLTEVRSSFSSQKDFLDYMFDQVTDMNLLAGLPQVSGGETKVALRNTGSVDVTVNITATPESGEKLSAPTTIRAKSYGEVSFRTVSKIARVEIDTDKLYPQTNYSDDTAPRETTDSDLQLAVKRSFDKQDYTAAVKIARSVLRDYPRFDDVRILLGRSLLGLNQNADAEKEFRTVLDEKLPSARSLAWANVGLADIASKSGQTTQAAKYAEDAIRADAEYGASLAARNIRTRVNFATPTDDSVKAYFSQFDKAAAGNRKAEIDTMVVPGDATKFANGISGQTEQWQTQVKQIDRIDANNIWVETNLTIKLLNKEQQSGTVVYRLAKVGGSWKLSSVDMFEVR